MYHGQLGPPIKVVSTWQRSLYKSDRRDDTAGTSGDSYRAGTLVALYRRILGHIDFWYGPLAYDDSTIVPETLQC